MYVLAISVLNNSATPALFASILSKLEQLISFSLSQTLPRFKCLSSRFLVSRIIHLMVRGLRWPNLPYVYPSRKKCFSFHWAWWLWHFLRLTPLCQVISLETVAYTDNFCKPPQTWFALIKLPSWMRTYRTFCKEQNGPSRSVDAVNLSPCKLKKRDAALDSQPDFSLTSSRLRSKEETDVWRFGFFPFVLIDRVEVCMAEKGYRYGVFFAARNESELEGRAFLCGQKRQRTRDPPLGSCTCRAREPVPIPVQNGAQVSCKWRIDRWTTRQWRAGNMKSKPRAKTDAGLAVISEEAAPRKFMDHGWVTVKYNVARCSLIIVPVELSRVGVTTRRRLIKYTYPREGSALVRKKKKRLHSTPWSLQASVSFYRCTRTGSLLDQLELSKLGQQFGFHKFGPPASVPGAQSLLLELTSRAKC